MPVNAGAEESPVNRLQTSRAQQETIRALQMMDQNQWELGRKAVANARDPLASKLYYWMLFTRKKDFDDFGRAAQFVRKNPEWPGISSLKTRAEENMPGTLSPKEMIAWFEDYPPRTGEGVDRYMQALINSGQSTKAKSFLADWWESTTLSRDEQRLVFRKYSAYLDREAHKGRFDTMLLRKQTSNARAIANVLENGYPELAEARIALAAGKKNVNALIGKVPASLQNDPGLLYERLKWRRKNDLDFGAMEILNKAPPADKIKNPKEWWLERHIIIRRLLEKKSYKSAYALASGHKQTEGFPFAQAEWVAGWLALRFLNEPTKAYQHFTAMYQGVQTPISKARGAFWAGRASEGFSDKTISTKWLEEAARYQTVFYGQLAGARLGKGHSLPNAAPPKLTAADKQYLSSRELLQAAKLFGKAGMHRTSSQFLQAFVSSEKTAKAYRYAAEQAIVLGQMSDAVRISKKATQQGMFLTAQSYPTLTEYTQGIDLEWALIHAIIRQESVFDLDAKSPAGALGLMQLMPATAKETAKKLGIPHSKALLTTNPRHNIRLGSAYLSRMVDRFDGSYPMAIAAYNAGPGRVDRWIKTFGDPRTGEIDYLDWVELIPIYETRNYVQRVMEGIYVYRLRLKTAQIPSNVPIHIALFDK